MSSNILRGLFHIKSLLGNLKLLFSKLNVMQKIKKKRGASRKYIVFLTAINFIV